MTSFRLPYPKFARRRRPARTGRPDQDRRARPFLRLPATPRPHRRGIRGRWFVTSDLGRLGPDGRLVVRGRADDVITTGGEKVVPAEVAALVEAHPAVREAVVFGMPDPDWGERVTAVVVAADPARPPALADLRAHVGARLPAFAAPREIVIAADIPMLPSGKADIAALRAWVREQSGGRSVST